MVETPLPAHKEFKEGVIVNFPGQGKPIQVQKLDLPAIESMTTATGGFLPFRLVINLKLVDAEQPNTVVSVFDPPIEVRVRFKTSDLANAAKARKPLCLGFWDGTQWIRVTPKDHKYRPDPGPSPQAGGWGVFSISQWGDPTIAVGT